jgi:hypothetical protein
MANIVPVHQRSVDGGEVTASAQAYDKSLFPELANPAPTDSRITVET